MMTTMQQPPRRAIESVGWNTAHGDTVTVFRSRQRLKQRWRWHVRSPNGEIVGHNENYVRRIDAITAAERHHPPVISPLAAEYRKRQRAREAE